MVRLGWAGAVVALLAVSSAASSAEGWNQAVTMLEFASETVEAGASTAPTADEVVKKAEAEFKLSEADKAHIQLMKEKANSHLERANTWRSAVVLPGLCLRMVWTTPWKNSLYADSRSASVGGT